MVSSAYELIEREADGLPSEQQLRLIAHLAQRLAAARPTDANPRWEDFAGSIGAPMCGEDAQQWVSRTRRESDQERDFR